MRAALSYSIWDEGRSTGSFDVKARARWALAGLGNKASVALLLCKDNSKQPKNLGHEQHQVEEL